MMIPLLIATMAILVLLGSLRKSQLNGRNSMKEPLTMDERHELEYQQDLMAQLKLWNQLAEPIRVKIKNLGDLPEYRGDNLEECMVAVIKADEILNDITITNFPNWTTKLGLRLIKIDAEQIREIETTNNILCPTDFKEFAEKVGLYTNELFYEDNTDYLLDSDNKADSLFLVTSDHGCGIEAGISLHPEHFGEYWLRSGGLSKLSDNIISHELNQSREQLDTWIEEDNKIRNNGHH